MRAEESATATEARQQEKDSKKVEALVAAKLRKRGYPALEAVQCRFHEGVLVLHGRVPTYYLKQVAQQAAAEVVDVEQIDNRLEVYNSPVRRPR